MRTFFSCLKAFFKSNSVRIPVLIFVFVALVTFGLGGLIVYKVAVDPIKLFQTPTPSPTPAPTHKPVTNIIIPGAVVDGEDVGPNATEITDVIAKGSGILNILLVGADYAPERENWSKNYYADVMMVIAIDFDNKTADMISVPRDTFAPIYNTPGIYKLNTSLYHGGGVEGDGFEYVAKSVSNLLGGVAIDYYIGVNMSAVKTLVDAIGGVDYYVEIEFEMNGRQMKEGYQHLNGQEVLDYCRVRKGVDNDIGRVDRQKKILIAVFEKLQKSSLLFDVPEIILSIKDDLHTNLSLEHMAALAIFGKSVDSDDITMHTVVGHFLQIFNWSIYILDDDERIELVEEVYGFTPEPMLEASQKYAKLKWATIQAETYIALVETTMEEDTARKISNTNRSLLKDDVKALRSALAEEDRYQIEQLSLALKERATTIFNAAGFKVSWFVNENPGKERMTG